MRVGLLFPDILVPDLGVFVNVGFQKFAAGAAVEIDHLDTILPKPLNASGERPALANNHFSNLELTDQTAAIPARRQCRDHNQISIALLPTRTPKCIRLSVHTRIALL